MSRLTLRLPDSLHDQLVARAKSEGVSLNQYIVYSLTRVTSLNEAADQRKAFDRLLTRYPAEKAESALAELLADRDAPSRR